MDETRFPNGNLRPGELVALLRQTSPTEAARYVAWRTVRHAIESGRIRKPAHCPLCGSETPARMMHAHHSDHRKPLDIDWMCQKCHVQHHRACRNDRSTPPDAPAT